MMSVRVYVGLFIVLLVSLSGCGAGAKTDSAPTSSAQPASSGPLKVVCTTGMVADVARNVGGDRISVQQLMGEGVDPHLYKTSPGDISLLHAADVIFYSGLHLEGKMGEVFENLARRKKTIAIADSLPKDRILEVSGHFADPHVWFDVSLWSETIGVVARTLSEVAPEHASEFKSRAADYKSQLQKLDQECRAEFASIPQAQRILVTAHDAFHYLGKAYGLDVKAIQGISTESEAGVKQINELVAFISQKKIKAVFIESSVSDRAVKALVEGCAQAGHTVKIGGELFSDAMGKPNTPEGTYLGMVRHNLHTVVNALK